MKAQEHAIDRREILKWIAGGAVLTAASAAVLVELSRKRPLPRISQLDRTVGDTAIPIPDAWYRTLDRISVEAMPLDKGRIESLPMLPVDDKGYCKTGAAVQAQKYGLAVPDLYEHLRMDFGRTKGRIMARATDWYGVIPAEPEKAYFSASKDNLPIELWSGKGFELAKTVRATPYGWFIASGAEGSHAWKDLADLSAISGSRNELEPGAYFLGPDGNVVPIEKADVSMETLDKLALTVVGGVTRAKIPYSKIKRTCEENRIPYKDRGKIPALALTKLLELSGIPAAGKAFILYANNYSVSIPPWRQEGLTVLFDERYSSFGTPTKLIGRYLNKAGQISGFYKIEAV